MNHSFNRRSFLTLCGGVGAGLAAQLSPDKLNAETLGANAPTQSKCPIGLELYSVRDELARNLPNTLKKVSQIGYQVVEFYSPYFQWTPVYAKDVRSQMDDLGLRCLSTHNGFESFASVENLNHAIELNQILGTRYLVLASAPGSAKGLDGWKQLCQQLTTAVEQLKPHGLSAGYHNHQAEWEKLENGQRVIEVIAANTPKEFMLQLDVGTCEEAGADPVAWVNANPGRIKTMHLKDWAPDQGYRVLFGEGKTPWKDLITAAKSVGGAEYLLIEQEGSRFSEFETAERCLKNYKQILG